MNEKNQSTCPTCQSNRTGKYCSQCGEKRVESSDFTLKHIFNEGFSFFTNLDSKLYKSITSLLFKPGFLTLAYIEGRRRNYMKPFQVFILASIFFYIFLSDMDILLVPSKWFFSDQNMELVEQVMAEKKASREMIAQLYDNQVISNSKLFIFLLLPILGLCTYAFNWRRMPEFGKHMILAVYTMSFFLVLIVVGSFLKYVPFDLSKWWYIIGTQVLFILYLTISIKKVFKRTLWAALLQGVIIMFVFGVFIMTYRYHVSYYTLSHL